MNAILHAERQLTNSLRQLSSNWESAKEVWSDATRENFDKNYWMEFESCTTASIEKLQELMNVLTQAEREMP